MVHDYSPEKILEILQKYYTESIFVTDDSANIIYANDAAAQRLGTTSESIVGRNVQELMAEGLYSKSTVLMAMQSGKTEISSIYPEHNNSIVSQSIPIFDEENKIYAIVTINMSQERSKEWNDIILGEKEMNDRLRRELDYLRGFSNNAIIVDSEAMQKVMRTIAAVAPTDSNVVVLGESGTGKDVIARLIHDHSERKDNSYIGINCAAIPDNLLESELFGYEKGAFTGALSAGKIGLFEAAKGGTIFLDEIGDMPLSLQAKLLRALENKEIRRVGGVKNIPIDVRIICATNANLMELVKEKRFREDLYYRLNVFEIKLPPLRERKEDIIPLAEHFLRAQNEKCGGKKFLGALAVDTMLKHDWPGNIRELRNVVERIYVVSPGDELVFTPTPTADINEKVDGDEQIAEAMEYESLKQFTDAMEQRYIQKVLKENGGCVSKTADKLKIHRSVLYRKLQKGKL